jgi:hypothetical protein
MTIAQPTAAERAGCAIGMLGSRALSPAKLAAKADDGV